MKSAGVREQLLSAAEELFDKQGYASTTVDQIVEAVGCSKSTFYHYFEAKEELACSPDLYDYAYEAWYDGVKDTKENAIQKLSGLNRVFLTKLEQTYDLDRASATCRFEVSTKNRGTYIGSNRSYNRIIRTLVKEGQARGDVRNDISFVELSKIYSLMQRGIIFDWCISGGTYSFMEFGTRSMEILLRGFLPCEEAG